MKRFDRIRKLRHDAQALWDESALHSQKELSPLEKLAHFCVMVGRSFVRNRCPVRASALAYATLLALIPMLAVVVGVTSTFLKDEGEDRIDQFIVRMVASITPPAMLSTNLVVTTTNLTVEVTNLPPTPALGSTNVPAETNSSASMQIASTVSNTNEVVMPSLARDAEAIRVRKVIARNINDFIQNTRSGTLGVTGSVVLIFVAIGMLTRIEDTFNDIWGVARGRGPFTRIVLYWGVITLAPLLIIVAIGLASGPHLEGTKQLLTRAPVFANLLFKLLPVVVLCVTFTVFYILMPNTKVRWRAALVGGAVAAVLFHLNSLISVLYVSRAVSYSKVYGSLGLVPVFMVGMYFAWLIVLLGSQVAYAYQNRATYLEERQIEHINQRGREFVALRLMTCIGQRFVRGEPPSDVVEMGRALCIPTRLIQQVMHTLCAARLVVEVAGSEAAYLPARPLESITCHDILQALRATHGHELATRDEPAREEVYGEFQRIAEAERQAAASVNMLALATRAQAKQLAGPQPAAACPAD